MVESRLQDYYIGMVERVERYVDTNEDTLFACDFTGLNLSDVDILFHFELRARASEGGEYSIAINGESGSYYNYKSMERTFVEEQVNQTSWVLMSTLATRGVGGTYVISHEGDNIAISKVWAKGYDSEPLLWEGKLFRSAAAITQITLMSSMYCKGMCEYGVYDYSAGLIPNR